MRMLMLVTLLGLLAMGNAVVNAQDCPIPGKVTQAIMQRVAELQAEIVQDNNWDKPHCWYDAIVIDVKHAVLNETYFQYGNLIYNPILDKVFLVGDEIREAYVTRDARGNMGPGGKFGLPTTDPYYLSGNTWCQEFSGSKICVSDPWKQGILNWTLKKLNGR